MPEIKREIYQAKRIYLLKARKKFILFEKNIKQGSIIAD